jgi:hypothetical protein
VTRVENSFTDYAKSCKRKIAIGAIGKTSQDFNANEVICPFWSQENCPTQSEMPKTDQQQRNDPVKSDPAKDDPQSQR